MKEWWRRRSVRISLTAWYAAAMVVVLAVYAGSVFVIVTRNASRALDDRLHGDLLWVQATVNQRVDGMLEAVEGEVSGEEDVPWLQVSNLDGEVLYRSRYSERLPIPEGGWRSAPSVERIRSVPFERVTFRVLSGPSRLRGLPIFIQVARSEAPLQDQVQSLLFIFVFGLPIGVVAAGVGGYTLAYRALRPIDRMADRAQFITAERLSDRLPVHNPHDELGRLASVFNETLGRLEESFDQMRRFTADVSHELRTPLTAIRSVGEVALRGNRDASAYRTVIGSMLEEVEKLAYLVDRLLTLSRAEIGTAKLALETVDLRELAAEVISHLGVLAEEKEQTLVLEGGAAPRCRSDRSLLRQALINLVDNAIKYTPERGGIRVYVGESPGAAILDVADTGPGISLEAGARIFDRFYRATHPRDDLRGSGLGLSIAKWAVEANGGRLSLEPTQGGGSRFRITLPTAGSMPRTREDLLQVGASGFR